MAYVKRNGSLRCKYVFSSRDRAELRKGGVGESGEELKLISCPLKTHVSFNHQLLPALPVGSEGLRAPTTKPIRPAERHNLSQLQSHSANV